MSCGKVGIDDRTQVRIEAVWANADDSLRALLRSGGLDPAECLRGANLTGWLLAGEDVRGFDFSGADLRGSGIEEALLDETTLLDGALLDELASETIPRLVARQIGNGSGNARLAAESFAIKFSDILDEEPVHSRHWVSRIASAWKAVEHLSDKDRETYSAALAQRSSEWLLRFRGKAETGLLIRVLALTEMQPRCHPQFVTTIVKLVSLEHISGSWELISSPDFEQLMRRQNKGGLYGLERVFASDKQYPFRNGFSTLAWFNRIFDELAPAGEFLYLWKLALIAFGERDPPAGDIDRYRSLHRAELKQLEQNIRDALTGSLRERATYERWPAQASAYLAQDDNLRYLRRVYDGEQRLPEIPQDEVGGISWSILSELDTYARGQALVPGLEYSQTVRAKRENASRNLGDKVGDWVVEYGPLNVEQARALLDASFGLQNDVYRSKLANKRLEIRGHLGPHLVVKGRDRLRDFRQVVRDLIIELEDS